MTGADPDTLRFGWGLSAKADPWDAAEAAAEQALERLGSPGVDVAFMFTIGAHAGHTAGAGEVVARCADPGTLIGTSASGCLAGAMEVEDASAVAVLFARMPGVEVKPFTSARWPRFDADHAEWLDAFAIDAGPGSAHRGTLLLADPFSVPIASTIERVGDAVAALDGPAGPIFGGLASRGQQAGQNRVLLNSTIADEGAVGLGFYGDVRIDTLVSQGCTPIGPTWVVTKSRGNLIMELGGRRAVDAAREVVAELEDVERLKFDGGLLLGRAVSEYRERFGRGDFLIRSVVGADEPNGYLAVGSPVPTGRTVQFHLRDKSTAEEDLALLLDGQALHGPPAGVLAFSGTARGRRLFGTIGHDARSIQRAFGPVRPGAEMAKGGVASDETDPPVPLAGIFAEGEIGPIGGRPFLHSHTLSMAAFRPRGPEGGAAGSDTGG